MTDGWISVNESALCCAGAGVGGEFAAARGLASADASLELSLDPLGRLRDIDLLGNTRVCPPKMASAS